MLIIKLLWINGPFVISVGSTKQKVQKAILTNTQLNFNDFM